MPAGARINRALWAFRATVALVALLLLAMILRPEAFQAKEPAAPRLATARGRTAQGVAMTVRFDRPGHPVGWATRVHPRCSNPARRGRWTWDWGWWPADGSATPFRRDGRVLRVTYVDDRVFDDGVFGQLVLSIRGVVGPGRGEVRGWVRLTALFFYANATTTCDSGRVPFAVGATSGRPS